MKFKLNESTILEDSNPNPEENIGGPESDISPSLEKEIYDNSDIIVNDDDDQVFRALNRAYATAQQWADTQELLEPGEDNDVKLENILFIGEAGTGKTARTEQWAKANNINLVNIGTSSLGIEAVSGAVAPAERVGKDGKKVRYAELLRTNIFDRLDEPNSVLFLDEYNRGRADVRQLLLTLIEGHKLQSGQDDTEDRYFPNLLFVVAAINPPDYSRTTDMLDAAEISRFTQVTIAYDLRTYWNWKSKKLKKRMQRYEQAAKGDKKSRYYQYWVAAVNQYNLLETLIKNGAVGNILTFDNAQDRKEAKGLAVFNGRTLDSLIEASRGKKDDFLALWDDKCNPHKKEIVEQLLADYEDIDDKANSVWGFKDEESEDDAAAKLMQNRQRRSN